jgi:hypothetical protein
MVNKKLKRQHFQKLYNTNFFKNNIPKIVSKHKNVRIFVVHTLDASRVKNRISLSRIVSKDIEMAHFKWVHLRGDTLFID